MLKYLFKSLLAFSLLASATLFAFNANDNQSSESAKKSVEIGKDIQVANNLQVAKGCNKPIQGPPGATGATGPAGATGPQGPAGGSSAPVTNALSIYLTIDPYSESVSLNGGDPVPYNEISLATGSALAYTPDSGIVNVIQGGNYEIKLGVVMPIFPPEASVITTVALYNNGVVVPGSTFVLGQLPGTSGDLMFNLISSAISATLNPGTLEVRIATDVTLFPGLLNTDIVLAYLVIEKI